LKKVTVFLIIIAGILSGMGMGFFILYQRQSSGRAEIKNNSYGDNSFTLNSGLPSVKSNSHFRVSVSKETKPEDYTIEENLPFGIEISNPVPEVKHWNFDQKTYFYFNWGLKKTGGYRLDIMSVKDHVIKVKALSPRKDQMLIEAVTFPSLLISLPQGDYVYEVVDENENRIQDIFSPKNKPLKMIIFVPKINGQIAKREILRDVSSHRKGKSIPLLALESLFNQQEMLNFISRGVTPDGIFYEKSRHQWIVELSKAYQDLSSEEKKLLCKIIRKTVLALTTHSAATVKILINPAMVNPS
jgi:hypothetical protein